MELLLAQGKSDQTTTVIMIVAGFVLLIFGLIILAVLGNYLRLYVQSLATRAGIGLFEIVAMSFRKINPKVIVQSKIMAVQAGLDDDSGITSHALQAHYMAGGRVPVVVRAMIAAVKAKILDLDFKTATAIDLAGRDVLEAVQTSVYPKVIDCPARGSGKEALEAFAKNGIQLKVKARVTVRTNIEKLIGGATESTIVARVGEGIISAIGVSESHWDVLENPDRISKAVLASKLDSQTAFEIVSIDIADIDVGENTGARLQADAAEAKMRVGRANAERRKAEAIANEQECIAQIEESRAKVLEAEAEVPQAIAEALRANSMSVLDYYKLRNVQADTEMRKSIAGTTPAGVGSSNGNA
jgi:uncharacterized protein YqfA (UPF0365 family)